MCLKFCSLSNSTHVITLFAFRISTGNDAAQPWNYLSPIDNNLKQYFNIIGYKIWQQKKVLSTIKIAE